MNIKIEITEKELRKLVLWSLQRSMPTTIIKEEEVNIEVKSKQNFKSEWESAAFRARLEVNIDNDLD